MHSTLIVLGLSSVFIFSMGFLVLAFLMNRQWHKNPTPRSPGDDE